MAARSYLKGQQCKLEINGETVAGSTSTSVSYTMNTEDTSSKDDDNAYYSSPSATTLQWSIDNESFIVERDNLATLMNALNNRTRVYVSIASGSEDKVNIHGYAYITSLEVTAQVGEYATVSMTLEGDGSDQADKE